MSKVEQLSSSYADYYTRLGDRLNSGAILKDLPQWICKNTTLRGAPWSFKDHEFQIDIIRDQSPEYDVQKCSQVGLSEVQARAALGIASIMSGKTIIYVMPHNKLAALFAKSRVDPIIEGSRALKQQMKVGSDSALMKQIGSSFIHFAGAESERSAISIPAQVLMIDEYDFCKMKVLGLFNSRTRHAQDEAMKRRFSTPTVSNYGISRRIAMSSKKRYFVKCIRCGHRQAPVFANDVVIPGFDKPFLEIDKDDFLNFAYKFDDAYLKCQRCGKELDSSLRVASLREWVDEHPTRQTGYLVKPFDLISHNTTVSVIRQRLDYESDQDYWNFVQGEPLDTDQNKINDVVVEACTIGDQLDDGEGWCIGIDVGKVCHIMIGKRIGGRRIVANIGKIRLSAGPLLPQICEIVDKFKFSRIVIDAGPDVSLPAGLQDKYGHQYVNPCVYVKAKKSEMTWYVLNEETGVVNASRTKALDNYVETINKGKWQFPRCQVMKEVRAHMQQMVRVEQADDEGEMVAVWETSSITNHFFHAGFYLHCAMEMDDAGAGSGIPIAPTDIHGIRVGGAKIELKKTMAQRGMSSDSSMANGLASMLGRIS